MALPESMSTLKTILYNTQGVDLTCDGIVHQILIDEQRHIRTSGLASTAFYAKAAKTTKRSNEKAMKRCAHCNFRGHNISECCKLKSQQESKAPSNGKAPKALTGPNTANVAAAQSENGDDSDNETIHLHIAVAPIHAMTTVNNHALAALDLTNKWIIDSGASRTMCLNREWFHSFTPFAKPSQITLGDSSLIPAFGTGVIHIQVHNGSKWTKVALHNVLYVPDLYGNLLSVPQITDRGAEVRFLPQSCSIYSDSGKLVGVGTKHGRLFTITAHVVHPHSVRVVMLPTLPEEGDPVPNVALFTQTSSVATLDIWHRRLGHLSTDSVLQMACRNLVNGMQISGGSPPQPCEPCLKGKQTRLEIQKSTKTCVDHILGRIFTDICGKMPTRSPEGFEYFATWINDTSRKVYISGLRTKADVFHHLKDFVSQIELETGHRVKIIRSDGGGEYTSSNVQSFLKGKGIRHELTTPNTPQHNGVAERMNRTLLDKVRAMLFDADLPETYWHHAIQHATYIHNVSPTRALDDKTPEEAWSGTKPDLSRLRIFGCKVFVHIPDSLCSKLGSKSLICAHLGYAPQHKAFRLIHLPSRRFLTSRDVVFDEKGVTLLVERLVIDTDTWHKTQTVGEQPSVTPLEPIDGEPPIPTATTWTPPSPNILSRPKCVTKPPSRYGIHASIAHTNLTRDPQTYAEAMSRPDATEWELACEDEKRCFERMGVYEIVPCPEIER